MSGTLYVVATPLGHLGDLSRRAADTLRTVPLVAAEDTRHTRRLLAHLDAHPDLVSLHQHSSPQRVGRIVDRLASGDDVALVTDAGTPAVSDPGSALVRAVRAAGLAVTPVPGPSAVATALSAAGFPADQYLFLGFPPRRGTARRRWLDAATTAPWTVVVFEAANRLVALLRDLSTAGVGDRSAMVGRELTKVHEELRSGTVDALAVYYEEHPPKGEVTLVLEGRRDGGRDELSPATQADARARAARLRDDGMTRRDTARELERVLGLSRNEAYRIAGERDG